MYNLSNRLNIVLYNMMCTMAFTGLLNFMSGYFGPHDFKDASFTMKDIDLFINDKYIDEHAASFTFDFKADLSGLFNWNTNMIFASIYCEYETEHSKLNKVVIWDQRILRTMTEFYHMDLKDEWVEYYLTDTTKSLKGKHIKVYFRWEQMTTVGPYYSGVEPIGSFDMPTEFVNPHRRRQHSPGPSGRAENY